MINYGLSTIFNQIILGTILPNAIRENLKLCAKCLQSLRPKKKKIPTYTVYNGFKYPPIFENLPPLDIITERLILPRIPFMQIKRLRKTTMDMLLEYG